MAAKNQIEKLLSKKELAVESGLSVSFIENAMANYSLPYYKIGRNVKFKISEINKWIDQRRKVS